jgi:malonyl-CoA O-methyltransferase
MTYASGQPVSAPRGYAEWASTYEAENVVTTLDQLAADRLTPALQGTRLLDAGCGTGRRLRRIRSALPSRAVGVDVVYEMLRAGTWSAEARRWPANADVAALPFASRSFDIVWCRLVLGHVPDLTPAYHEFSRVLDGAGLLIVTDFHPAAAAAGHQRTFKDASAGTRSLAFHAHSLESHAATATAAGFEMVERCEMGVGPEVRSFYEAADRLARYEADLGLRLVFGLAFRRPSTR